MFEQIRFKLRHYNEQPFSALECLDSKEREERFYITVVEHNKRVHEWAIEPWAGDNIFEIADKLAKESCVKAVVFSDYKKHIHYWKEFDNG